MVPFLAQIKAEEARNFLGAPRKYQLIDFLGVGLGSYFIWETLRRPRPEWVNVALGAIMIYIHSERFVYAPQTTTAGK